MKKLQRYYHRLDSGEVDPNFQPYCLDEDVARLEEHYAGVASALATLQGGEKFAPREIESQELPEGWCQMPSSILENAMETIRALTKAIV